MIKTLGFGSGVFSLVVNKFSFIVQLLALAPDFGIAMAM